MSSALPAEAPQHRDLQGVLRNQRRVSLYFDEVLRGRRFVHEAEAAERKVVGGEANR